MMWLRSLFSVIYLYGFASVRRISMVPPVMGFMNTYTVTNHMIETRATRIKSSGSSIRSFQENKEYHELIKDSNVFDVSNDKCDFPVKFSELDKSLFVVLLMSSIMFFDVTPSSAIDVVEFDINHSVSVIDKSVITSSSQDLATVDYKEIIDKATRKALGGGRAGATAAVVQVCSLMWLRTAMNYQYRYGGDLISSLKKLYSEGGISRFYQGLPFAIVQGPLTRFGDTAANVGILALLESLPETSALPLPVKTACSSVVAGVWRIFLMPIDTSKTAMQVEGLGGLTRLKEKVLDIGPSPLYQGSLAAAAATAVGHFPWFLTFNFLNEVLPSISKEESLMLFLVRSAACGLTASCASDICSNSLRVIKTTKQTGALSNKNNYDSSGTEITYKEAVSLILKEDGITGLFTRGLSTRLLTNAIQGAAFSVLWKYFQTMQ